MSASPEAAERAMDRNKLGDAIADAQGDVVLLELAIEGLGAGDAWTYLRLEPMSGYKLFLLTNDQARALHHAFRRLRNSVDDAAVEFFGREMAREV